MESLLLLLPQLLRRRHSAQESLFLVFITRLFLSLLHSLMRQHSKLGVISGESEAAPATEALATQGLSVSFT